MFFYNIVESTRIHRKNALFGPLGGGDHSRTQKVKIYNKNITENRTEKSGDDFPIKSLGNPQFSMISSKSTKKALPDFINDEKVLQK